MKLLKRAAFFVALCGLAPGAWAQLYWDANGTDPGAGATPVGIWGTDAFWTAVLDGTGVPGAWTPGAAAVFSAGDDASGAFTVTVTGTQTASGMTIEEGVVSIAGGAVAVGGGSVTINSGATLSTDSSLRLTATAGATLNINGGTLRTTNPGAAGTFYDTDFLITIGAAGATFSHTTANINNIVQTATTITGPGGLTKTGAGVLSIAGTATYQGPTVINDGEFRIRTTADRLPVTTAMTVTSPGILNLNNVSQRIGSLSGDGLVGLGGATLTVGDATDTTFTGAIRNIANAGAAGVTSGNGRVVKVGAGALTLTGSNHYSGSLTLNEGTVTAAAGSRLCDVICDVIVHGGTLNLDNEAQTILSLAGNGGAINLGTGHILTVNPSNTRTNASAIGGAGALTKTGTGTLILAGNNNYDGVTTVSAGTLEVRSASGLGSIAGNTVVGSGATLAFRGGINYGSAEGVTISGGGASGVGAINNTGDNNSFAGTINLAEDSVIGAAAGNLTLGGLVSDSGTPRTVTKVGAGTLTLNGNNLYAGNTLVSEGTLVVGNDNNTESATGSGAVTVAAGATLKGPGRVAGTLTLNGSISPGASPGTILTTSEIWNGGGSYVWEVNSPAATMGADPGWDLIDITGGLTINATSANKFTIDINSITAANESGLMDDFLNTTEYTWTIVRTTTGITGFDREAFTLDSSGVINDVGNGGFALELGNGGNDLVLRFIQQVAITAQPVSQTVMIGDMVTLSVTATGSDPTYQWRKEGTNLVGETQASLAYFNVQSSHAGNYDVVVANGANSVTSTVAVITIASAPMITAQPSNVSVCAGDTAMFSVTASGPGPLSYQWRTNGVEIPGATSSTLVIPDVQADDIPWSYTVRVTNEFGATISDPATLALNTPTTAIGPENVPAACVGSSASFTTTPAGTGPFTFVWRKDGTPLSETSGTLTIATVAETDVGMYCVEVTGDCGSVTNCATLSVATAPTITAQPQNQTTPMGNNATFSVTANSGAPATYQWQLNESDISGATASSYTASGVTLAQTGESYRVIVSNCAGSVTSAVATVTVTPIFGISYDFNTPGQFVNVPHNVQINEWLHGVNNSGQFPPQMQETTTGGVDGGGSLDIFGAGDMQAILPQASYDFSLDGRRIVASTMVRIVAPTVNSRATQIGFVTATNVYAGTAPGLLSAGISDNNPQGFMTVILQSTAQPAPTYELRLQHRRTAGSIAEVTAPTGRAPAGAVTLTAGNWYKLTATFVNTEGTTPDTFTVEASLQDMGANGSTPGAVVQSYPPNVVNNPDLVNQKNMYLALRCNNTATGADRWDNIHAYTGDDFLTYAAPLADQTVLQGRQATFQAQIDGTGPYSYQWFKNSSAIPGARSWRYITPPVTSADNGATYSVEVTGPFNTEPSNAATLTVQPDALAVVSVGSVDGCVVGVRFNQPVDPVTAANPANYLINGIAAASASVYSTHILPDGRNGTSVLLTPASILSGAFTVTVQNVQDLSGDVVGAMNSANGTVAGLTGMDINSAVALPAGKSYSFGAGQFEVTGGGVDIFSSPDSFRYVYTQKSGDFDVIARAVYQDVVRGSSKAGFDVRASLDPTSQHVLAAVNPMWPARGLYEGTYRQIYGSGGISWGAPGTPVRYPNGWMRLRRTGNSFIRYSSQDGVNWQNDGVIAPTPALPETVLLGFAVVSAANGTPSTAIFDNYGDFGGYPGATIAITTEPVGSATVAAGGSTNLSVTATVTGAPANGELTYVWQRSNGVGGWTNMPTAGGTNNVLNTGALFGADNLAEYRVIVKAPGAADVTSTTTVVSVTDSAAPTLTSATIPNLSVFTVVLVYSEPVSTTALNTANYSITNAAGTSMGVASAAFLSGDPRTVVLTTSSQLVAGSYGVRVSNVEDLGGNVIVADTLRTFSQNGVPPQQLSPIVVETFGGLPNTTNILDLTANVKWTANTPDYIAYSNVFGINPLAANFPNTLDNYGARIYSHFVPPTNGAYKFYIRADDFAEFLMNTTGPDRSGAVVQVAMTGNAQTYATARAVTNTLVAGQRYYIELRFKETTGGDGGTLAVRNDNTVPGQGEVAPASLFAFPNTIAAPTPVVVELYTGQATVNSLALNDVFAAFGSGGYPDLVASSETLNFMARLPNFVAYEKTFAVCSNLSNTSYDNYLGRMYAYFVAPSNGLYKFYARSDDSSELWMNTNAVNSTDPAGISRLGIISDFYDVNYRLMAQNVSLAGGQRYYIEGRWREGGSGDGMTIAIRAQSVVAPPPSNEIMAASFFEFPVGAARAGAVGLAGITPVNPVVNDGETVMFVAQNISGGGPYGLFWLKNGQQIFGNSASYTTQPLTPADNGAVFTLVVTNAFSRAEQSSTVTVLSDVTAPAIVSAVGSQYQDIVVVTFSEPLHGTTGACVPNYSINNGLTVLSATLDGSGRKVTLRTTPQTPGTTYTVTVNGVRDGSSLGNTIAANSTASFTAWIAAGSGFYVEVFTNIAGGAVANLTADAKFVNNVPDFSYYTNRLGAGLFNADTGLNNYGARVSGLFSAPSNGLYRFYIRGDDGTQLFMNTNGAAPAGRVLIARNDGANSSTFENGTGGSASPILSLNAGTLYYVEALMKEGGGGDHMEAALRAIDPTTLTAVGGLPPVDANQAISGQVFVSMGNPDRANLTVSEAPPESMTVVANDVVTLRGSAYAPNFDLSQVSRYQWQRADGIGDFIDVPGAIGPTFTFVVSESDTAIRFIASGPGTNAVYTTTLTVTPDNVGPSIVAAESFDGTNIFVCFSEPILNSVIIEQFNWSVNGETPPAVDPYPDPTSATSTKAIIRPFSPIGAAFTLDATLTDPANNLGVSSTNGVVAPQFTSTDVGFPAAPGSSFGCVDGEIDVVAGGSDIWGTGDIGHLTLAQRTGNFDVRVRVESLTRPDAITKAGLMVRETLAANSRTLFLAVNPSQIQFDANPSGLPGRDLGEAGRRLAPGGTTAAWPGSTTFVPTAVPNAWLRIKRSGDLFMAMRSYDGVNWRTFGSWSFGYPSTVYVGLATTAHTQPAPAGSLVPTFAKYRDLYLPSAPVILVQPSPADQTVPLHTAVSYSVVASNPPPNVGPLSYQWYRNMAAIPGETNATLNIPDAMGSDNGMYMVEVSNDGGTVTSDTVNLVANTVPVANADAVMTTQNTPVSVSAGTLLGNDSDPDGAGLNVVAVSGLAPVTFSTDFNSGLPAGALVFGTATVEPAGGVANSGYLRINPGIGGQSGSLVLPELTPGRRVSGFTASFKLRIGDVSNEPADGFSFNFAPDLPNGTSTSAENGVGTGLSFAVDNYRFLPYPQGGLVNTSGLKVRYRGVDVAGVRIPSAWNSARFVPVSVTVTPEGVLTVLVDGTNVFGTITLPNYTPLNGRFGIYARTGGEYAGHAIDDLSIATVLTLETIRQSDTLFGSAYINGGILHITDNVNSQAGSYLINDAASSAPVTSFNASFKLRIGNGTAEPADGFSFNFGSDLPSGATGPRAAEDGMGTGFSFCVDNYRFAPYPTGGTGATSGMKIRYGGVDIAGVQMPAAWNNAAFIPVSISVGTDGALVVLVDGTNVFGGVILPAWTPASGRFGMYARTGGQNETHWVDDLTIDATTTGSPVSFANDFSVPGGAYGSVVLNSGNITYTPAYNVCGADVYYYLASDGQVGGISIGTVNVSIDESTPVPPVIVSCPTNRTIICAGPLPDLRGELMATDNCCCVSITQDPAPGTVLAYDSVTTVTFTVTDTGGRSTMCQAIVTVPPSALAITTQPMSQTVFANTTASFSVVASGEPVFTYQWRKNGMNIDLATGSTLEIANVQESDEGDYTVVVTDGCGASLTSQIATLTVTPCDPIAIATQPANTTAAEGTAAMFSVGVTGTAPYTFQWFEGGTAITDATNSTYSRVITCLDNGHVFHVVVGNPCGQLTSASATLTVVAGPTSLQIVRQGADVVISWPVNCGTFIVEETISLNPGNSWAPAAGTASTVGNEHRLTIPYSATENRFYRLSRP